MNLHNSSSLGSKKKKKLNRTIGEFKYAENN